MQEKLIERYGVGVVRRGGLRIHTTIDPKMQEDARNAVNAVLRAIPAGPSSAIVAIDPANGKIRAMASTRHLRGRATSTSPPRATASPAPRSRRSC